jgi:hypothetical protein
MIIAIVLGSLGLIAIGAVLLYLVFREPPETNMGQDEESPGKSQEVLEDEDKDGHESAQAIPSNYIS